MAAGKDVRRGSAQISVARKEVKQLMWNDLKLYVSILITGVAKDDEGQTLVEYALIIALVAVLLVGALTALQVGIGGALANAVSAL
jgi:Flp pilus assembly pilin Flp